MQRVRTKGHADRYVCNFYFTTCDSVNRRVIRAWSPSEINRGIMHRVILNYLQYNFIALSTDAAETEKIYATMCSSMHFFIYFKKEESLY